eukprot:13065951-Ditylum_brightwellii.AAC.1
MGRQQRGFCSLSGHVFMIGGHTKNINCIVCAKDCAKYARAKARNARQKNECPKNYEGSSKAMEADAALVLTRKLYNEKGVVLEKSLQMMIAQ